MLRMLYTHINRIRRINRINRIMRITPDMVIR